MLNYYPYLARFLSPHQRDVVRMLQFGAQSAHALVPPDALDPVIRAIVNNFVTERNAAEVNTFESRDKSRVDESISKAFSGLIQRDAESERFRDQELKFRTRH